MTTIVLERGSDWGTTRLYGDWGEGADEATEKMLGGLVVDRFEELAADIDDSIRWYPSLSEVHGDVNDRDAEADLTTLRDQAFDEVWTDWTDGKIDPVEPSR